MRPGRLASLGAAAAMFWGASGPALAQKLGQAEGGGEVSTWRVLGALALCLVLAVAAAYALRHRLRGSGVPTLGPALGAAFGPTTRRMRLVETVRLSHQADICLMRCDGKTFVVASTAQGVVLLSMPVDLDAQPQPQPEAPSR